jgi:CDP-paratose synthetase
MIKLLLTGGTGYLGGRLARALDATGYKLVFLVRAQSKIERISDLLNRHEFIYDTESDYVAIFKRLNLGGVIHCATHYGRRDIDPLNTITANLLLPIKLLHAAAELRLDLFLNTGTMLDKRVNYYSLSKYQFEDWLEHYGEKIHCINMLLEHFYGPNDDDSKFVASILNALKEDVDHIDLTLGEQKRDFIYIDDVVAAILVVLKFYSIEKKYAGVSRYEVGSGNPIRIKDFVQLAKNIMGNTDTKLNFGAIPYRNNEVMSSCADVAALYSIGWKPTVGLKVGITNCLKGSV